MTINAASRPSVIAKRGSTFYNEWDADAAEWLAELVRTGRLPPGTVDRRSVAELAPLDIPAGDAHFFAGIGGWPLALEMSAWPATVPVWTGSCPCQPFSTAGDNKRDDDERHVWPAWFGLIREREPECVVGEQVASPSAHDWMRGVQNDLESAGYAVGYAVLPAAGVAAPHNRARIFWGARRLDHAARGRRGIRVRPARGRSATEPLPGPWRDHRRLYCPFDRQERRIPADPGIPVVAHGLPSRLGERASAGFGNAIVPLVGAVFLDAFGQAAGVIE